MRLGSGIRSVCAWQARERAIWFHVLNLRFEISEPLWRMGGIFQCYSGGDPYSLFRDRVVIGRLCDTAFNDLASAAADALQCKTLMSRPLRISNSLSSEKSTSTSLHSASPIACMCEQIIAPGIYVARRLRLDQWTILFALAMPDHAHVSIFPLADHDASISGFAKWFKRWFNETFWNRRPAVSDGRQRSRHVQGRLFDQL